MLESKLYFCGWSHVERSWSWPFQEYWLIISCHFCFLQDLSLMWCSLSIFFGLGPRITTFINYCIVYTKNLYWKEFAQLFQNARVYAEWIISFMLSFCAGDFVLLNFVLADSRITIKNLFHFYSSPVALGQIYFVLVLILTNHNTRYLYPEMEISQTVL